ATALAAMLREVLPVAQPFRTALAGIPVSPSSPTTASGLVISMLPAKAQPTSCQRAPASERASLTASAPISSADLPAKRPNGCRPTPTIATSMVSPLRVGLDDGLEGEDGPLAALLVLSERHDRQFHHLADGESLRRRLRQTGLDPERTRQLHVADGEGLELPRSRVRRRSEEHTSELQSRENLVCRLLLAKKNYLNRY